MTAMCHPHYPSGSLLLKSAPQPLLVVHCEPVVEAAEALQLQFFLGALMLLNSSRLAWPQFRGSRGDGGLSSPEFTLICASRHRHRMR
mmetsp:Transcript_25591/g.56434  ORF Transcript_25591/g.56434 Transcript_25591/m.56434 type:complete len:88 (+) Transcript_25591:3639-3902(+)